TRGGDEDTGEHLDRRGLARAVGSEVADDLALGYLEADTIDGGDRLLLAREQRAHRREAPLDRPGARENLDEIGCPDHVIPVRGPTRWCPCPTAVPTGVPG